LQSCTTEGRWALPRPIEDLQIATHVRHVLQCELDSAECPECLKIQRGDYSGSWPPKQMLEKETWMNGISFAENFHVKLVNHEHQQSSENSARKSGVRSMLRRLRGLPQ
jgi:hypothetical protein